MGYHSDKGIDEASMKEVLTLIHKAEKVSDLKRLQCIYFRAKGVAIEDIAEITQYSIAHIKRIWTRYFSKGINAVYCKQRGGRNRCHLSVEDEAALLEKHSEQAGEGQMLKMQDLHRALCKIVGAEVAPSTIYRMASRHGWRKVAPRPFHPKRDGKKATYFKVFFP